MGQAIQGPPPINQGQQLNLPYQANLGQSGINQGQLPNAPIQAPPEGPITPGINDKMQDNCSTPGASLDKLNKTTTKVKDKSHKTSTNKFKDNNYHHTHQTQHHGTHSMVIMDTTIIQCNKVINPHQHNHSTMEDCHHQSCFHQMQTPTCKYTFQAW